MSASLSAHSTIMKVVRQANPKEDLRRQNVFAWAVTALLFRGTVSLPEWITVMSGPAKASSKLRRFWRFLDNSLVNVAAYYRPFIRAALAGWAGQHVLLAVDTTSPMGHCVVCRVSLVFRGRAIPIYWQIFETKSHTVSFESYRAVLEGAMELLPPRCTVTLLGDRGFGHRKLMRWCQGAGWHYLLRIKGSSTIILPNGQRRRLDGWAVGATEVFQFENVCLLDETGRSVGPLNIHVGLSPEAGAEVWYIASDRTDTCAVLADYRCRMNIDHSFRDDKSGGWNWEASHLIHPEQVDRLCLVMAVATLFSVTEGTLLIARGEREAVDPHTTRGLSYFQLGLRHFKMLLAQGKRLRLKLRLAPCPDPEPVCPYGVPFKIFGFITWLPGPSRPAAC